MTRAGYHPGNSNNGPVTLTNRDAEMRQNDYIQEQRIRAARYKGFRLLDSDHSGAFGDMV